MLKSSFKQSFQDQLIKTRQDRHLAQEQLARLIQVETAFISFFKT